MVSSNSYPYDNGLAKDKEMLKSIEQELKKSAVCGSVWQVISADWFNKWKSFLEFCSNQSSELSEEYIRAELGKIDNSKLESPFAGELKAGLTEGVDFILIPDDAAAFLFKRYGGGPQFQRDCINVGTKVNPRLIISLYRVRIESFHCTGKQTNYNTSSTFPLSMNEGKCEWNTHFLSRHTSFNDAMDILAMHYKVAHGVSSKTRHWIKISDEEGSSLSKPRKSKLARILSCDVTDVTDDNWKFLRFPVHEDLGSLLGDKECIQIIVETTHWQIPLDSDWPRANVLEGWRNKLQVGDIVDAQDKYKKWYTAEVLEVNASAEAIFIHFKGFSSSFNERVSKSELQKRIKPAFSETFDRFRWKVGDKVELKVSEENSSNIDSDNSAPIWMPVTVAAVDLIQDRVQVSYLMGNKIKLLTRYSRLPAVRPVTCDDDKKSLKLPAAGHSTTLPADAGETFQWVEILSDDICPQYTHVQPEKATEDKAPTVANQKDSFASSMSLILSKPPATAYTSSYSRYDYYGDKNTRGDPPCAGVVGLCNLGNTCFMNSILQCLSNTQAITNIFTSESYKEDINSDNPLGHGGKLAKVYAQLIQDIWSGSYVKIYPREFKTTIGDFQPQFAGYEQQDSQELMNFLLDGLHEDLNRVQKKPHVTKIESKGRSDSLIASESWRRYLLRNDSSLVDRCFAQLKSHVTCVNCGNESVTFDEYSSVSLPLPIKNTRIVTVVVRLLPLSSAPLKIDLEVELTDPMDQLKRILVNKLLSLKLMDLNALQKTDSSSSKVVEKSEDFEMVSHSDASMSPPCVVDAEELRSIPEKKLISNSTDLTDSILKNLHFHFGCLFCNRTTSVFKNYDADTSSTRAGAIHAFVGRNDTLMAFQLEHETPIAKATYNYYSYYNVPQQKPSPTYCMDICLAKKEKSAYSSYDTSRLELFGYPIRVSFPTAATNRDVLQKVSEIARRYFREDSTFCADYDSKELTDRPYEVAVCNAYSGYITRRISSADDEVFVPTQNNDILSIAWTSVGMETDFDEQQVGDFRVFSSSSQVNLMGEVVSATKLSIYDCIDKFIEREQLASTETMYCSNCKEHLAPIKKFDFWSTPDILILHLKRFQYVPGQYFVHREKISEVIDFPVVGLDLSRYVIGQSSNDAPPIYDLYAVSNHMGGLGGGHYTATCKNFINNTWYDFNDSSVTEANAAEAVSGSAYVLFYQRRKGQLQWGGVVPTKEPISDT